MVKPKVPTKQAQQKKPASHANKRSASMSVNSPAASDPCKLKNAAVSTCTGCGIVIGEDVKALQCDCCQGENWKCADCLGLTHALYDQLVADPVCSLCWFCDACDKIAMDTGHDHDSVNSSDRIDKLVDLVQMLLEKMSTMDDKLHKKCDFIEAHVKKVEERVIKGEKDLELRLAELNKQVSQYVGKLDTDVEQKLAEMDKHVSKCMDAQAVQEALSTDKSEKNEIERRKTNVIVHGVPESDADDVDR